MAQQKIQSNQLADTDVIPGSYTSTNLTVDAAGRITAASNGSGGGSGSLPLNEIGFGTGDGITSDPRFQYDPAAGILTIEGDTAAAIDAENKNLTIFTPLLVIDSGDEEQALIEAGAGENLLIKSGVNTGNLGTELEIQSGDGDANNDAGNIILRAGISVPMEEGGFDDGSVEIYVGQVDGRAAHFSVSTNDQERLRIGSAGAWYLNNDSEVGFGPGDPGDVLTSNGQGTPPAWQPPGGFSFVVSNGQSSEVEDSFIIDTDFNTLTFPNLFVDDNNNSVLQQSFRIYDNTDAVVSTYPNSRPDIDYILKFGSGLTVVTNGDPSSEIVTVTAAGGSPGGANTQIQFNDNGAFGGSSKLTWTQDPPTGGRLTLGVLGSTTSIKTPDGNPVADLAVFPGSSSNTSKGGSLFLQGGASGSGDSGDVTILTGNASGAGAAGTITLRAGNGGTGVGGGNITLTAGNAVSGTITGGAVSIYGGNPFSGTAQGNVTLGGIPGLELTVGATGGFVNIPTVPGVPTGIPATTAVGHVAMVYDSTNNKLYVRNIDNNAWVNVSGTSGGTPGGANTNIQFNDGGVFGGDARLSFNKLTGGGRLILGTPGSSAGIITPAGVGTSVSDLFIQPGDSAGSVAGGSLTLQGGNSNSGPSGNVTILTSSGSGTSTAGNIILTAGTGGSTNAGGGAITITAGAGGGSTTGPGGAVSIFGGAPASATAARGNVNIGGISGGTLATTTTGGFITIPSCAGTPTGIPANMPVGQVPMIYDSTNNKLYVRNIGNTAWIDVSATTAIQVACSDETTALTAGTNKVTFRMPHAMTVTGVRASLTTAQTSGTTFTVDINEAGTSILSTKLTINNGQKTSVGATPPVISDSALADDAEITVDIDLIGDGTAKGLKITLLGTR